MTDITRTRRIRKQIFERDPDIHQRFLIQLSTYRAELVCKLRTIEACQPRTGNELRPFCQTILSIDRLRLDVADMEAA